MTTHYTILTVQIRPEIQERISIGFALFDDNQVFFKYSKHKLSVAKSLLSVGAYKLLNDAIRNIESSAINQKSKEKEFELTNFGKKNKEIISVEYLNYLSRYNTNLLTFSSPKKIDVDVNNETFILLFKKYVDDIAESKKIKYDNIIEVFKRENIVRLKRYYNIEKQLSSDDIKGLIAPVKIDMVGKNEDPVYVKSVNLNREVHQIKNDLAQLAFLNIAYAEQKVNAKAFILSAEPFESKAISQHKIWNELRKNSQFEYVDASEAERVLEYAEDHGVQPLFPESTDDVPF